MSAQKLLDNRINIFTKKEGTGPINIQIGHDIFNELLDDCGQDFGALDILATHYAGIPIELIRNNNTITSKLIILN